MFYKGLFLLFILFLNFDVSAAEELKIISTESFVAQNPSQERQAIVEFIIHQFDNKREFGISQKKLNDAWDDQQLRDVFFMARFQIIDQKLYADSFDMVNHRVDTMSNRFFELLLYFQRLISLYKINDVDFIFYMRDTVRDESGLANNILDMPAFTMSKDINATYEKNLFLFPDISLIMNSWQNLILDIEQANVTNLWDSKIEQIFWRGATTGDKKFYNINNFDKLPRLTLVMQSKLYPDLIDARFTNYAQISNDLSGRELREILDILFEKNMTRVKEIDHLKYKYLMSIDGNNCTWGRPVWIMLANSVLVKQETSKIQWFYPAMKPYVHYVPVNERLTDIFSQIEWMKTHDQELQQISQNAQKFVKNNLMPEHLDAQTVLILNEYHKLHKGDKITATMPPVEETLAKIAALRDTHTKMK